MAQFRVVSLSETQQNIMPPEQTKMSPGMVRCRSCKQPKWRRDICTNPECKRAVSPKYRLTELQRPISVVTPHGFHEPGAKPIMDEQIQTDAVLIPSEEVMKPEFAAIADEILPSDATVYICNGQPLPLDSYRERLIVQQNTIKYWQEAHEQNNEWHQRFPGYCLMCGNLPS